MNDEQAVLDREAGEQLLARLDFMALQPKRMMNWSGGDYCGLLLRQHYPTAELIDRDASIEDYSIDLILSNLFLPVLNQSRTDFKFVLQAWQRLLRPEGLLMLSSFGPDTLQELREAVPIQWPVFMDMHDLGDALVDTGFADPVLDIEYFTLTYREQQTLKRDLEAADFVMDPLTETWPLLPKNAEGVIPITYEVIYGHAWQPEISKNRLAENGIVKFPLAHLKMKKNNV